MSVDYHKIAQGVLQEMQGFAAAMQESEQSGADAAYLTQLAQWHTAKAAYFQAAATFAVAGAIQNLPKQLENIAGSALDSAEKAAHK